MYTVVSLVPFDLHETKPGLFPGEYNIPAAKDNDFQVFHVGPAKYYIYLDSDRGSHEAFEPDYKVAEAIVNDFCLSQLATGPDAMPGMFCVEGKLSKDDVIIHHEAKLKSARITQNNWYKSLVKNADDDWSRYHQHKIISDLQRFAAKSLGLDREWLIITSDIIKRCGACRVVIDPEAIICSNCRAILDVEKAKQFGFVKV
jgi:hypothetical protein